MSQNGSKTVTIKSANSNDGAHRGGLNAAMGGLRIQWCACGDRGGNINSGTVDVDVACP